MARNAMDGGVVWVHRDVHDVMHEMAALLAAGQPPPTCNRTRVAVAKSARWGRSRRATSMCRYRSRPASVRTSLLKVSAPGIGPRGPSKANRHATGGEAQSGWLAHVCRWRVAPTKNPVNSKVGPLSSDAHAPCVFSCTPRAREHAQGCQEVLWAQRRQLCSRGSGCSTSLQVHCVPLGCSSKAGTQRQGSRHPHAQAVAAHLGAHGRRSARPECQHRGRGQRHTLAAHHSAFDSILTFSAMKAYSGWNAVRPISTSPMNSWRAPAKLQGGARGGASGAGRGCKRAPAYASKQRPG